MYLLEVEDRVFGVVAVETWKLNHEVEKVGMLLQAFVNYFNLSERQSIKPVDLRQMTVTMLLTQLLATQQCISSMEM